MEAIVLENAEGQQSLPKLIPQAVSVYPVKVVRPSPAPMDPDEHLKISTVFFERTDEAIEVDGVCCTIYREVG